MFWLNWDFALIAIAATPFLLFFVARFNRAVKKATHDVRKHQAQIVSVVQEGLESVRVVKAYGRQDLEEENLSSVSHATVESALKARKIKAVLSPVVSIVAGICTGIVLWRGTALVLSDAMTIGALTVFLTYLSKFFKPVQDLAKMGSTIAQTAVGIERVQTILNTDTVIPERPDAREPSTLKGAIEFEHIAFAYDPKAPVLKDVHAKIAAG
jgi:subfamily B ATP-binding cassette protein MsbA